jgi:transcriptional regulator with XRE-family HTH domain
MSVLSLAKGKEGESMSEVFNYAKLRGRIVEKCGSQASFASKTGISVVTLTQKLKGRVAFRNDEILRMAKVLDIPTSKIPDYFFCIEN